MRNPRLLPLGKRLSKHQTERRNAKMTERSRLGKKLDFLGLHYTRNVTAITRLTKIQFGIHAATVAALIALAGRVLGAW